MTISIIHLIITTSLQLHSSFSYKDVEPINVIMFTKLFILSFIALTNGFVLPFVYNHKHSPIMNEGKGFGDGEATCDSNPTYYDLNDPKGKQTAIFKAETYAEYMIRRNENVVVNKQQEPPVKNVMTYYEYIKTRDNRNKRGEEPDN